MKLHYFKTKPNSVINVTEIVVINYYKFQSDFVFSGEKHNFWEMVYVESGEVEIDRDGERVILKKGEILFHQPNEFHTIKAYNSSPSVFVISFVCKSVLMEYFRWYQAKLNIELVPFLATIIAETKATYVLPGINKLVLRDNAPIGGEQLIKLHFEEFLIMLVRHVAAGQQQVVFSSKELMENHLVAQMKDYMEQKVTENIKIEDLCAVTGYSKTYLSHLFKEQCGISLKQYFTLQKIEYAKKLFREHGHNVTHVADMLNFDNPQYFARVFKKVTGKTPTEYIAQAKEMRK